MSIFQPARPPWTSADRSSSRSGLDAREPQHEPRPQKAPRAPPPFGQGARRATTYYPVTVTVRAGTGAVASAAGEAAVVVLVDEAAAAAVAAAAAFVLFLVAAARLATTVCAPRSRVRAGYCLLMDGFAALASWKGVLRLFTTSRASFQAIPVWDFTYEPQLLVCARSAVQSDAICSLCPTSSGGGASSPKVLTQLGN